MLLFNLVERVRLCGGQFVVLRVRFHQQSLFIPMDKAILTKNLSDSLADGILASTEKLLPLFIVDLAGARFAIELFHLVAPLPGKFRDYEIHEDIGRFASSFHFSHGLYKRGGEAKTHGGNKLNSD